MAFNKKRLLVLLTLACVS